MISTSIVYANSFSDHDLVGVIRKMHVKKFVPRKVFVRDYSNYDKDAFNISYVILRGENS